MARAFFATRRAKSTKDPFVEDNAMALVYLRSTLVSTRASGSQGNTMAKANWTGTQECLTKENFKAACLKVLEL